MNDFFDKAKQAVVKAVDQNGDGTLDKDDFAAIVGNAQANAVRAADSLGQKANQAGEFVAEAKRKRELSLLRPIFEEDLSYPGFTMPKLISYGPIDNRHKDSDVCRGSIGHYEEHNKIDIAVIYSGQLHKYGIKLFPMKDNCLYLEFPTFIVTTRFS